MVVGRQKGRQGGPARAVGGAEAVSAAHVARPAQGARSATRGQAPLGHAHMSPVLVAGRAAEPGPLGAFVSGRNGAVQMAGEHERRTPDGDQSHLFVCFWVSKLTAGYQNTYETYKLGF